jgi:hypothetical protein
MLKLFYLNLPLYTMTEFDLATRGTASRDDTTRPRHRRGGARATSFKALPRCKEPATGIELGFNYWNFF